MLNNVAQEFNTCKCIMKKSYACECRTVTNDILIIMIYNSLVDDIFMMSDVLKPLLLLMDLLRYKLRSVPYIIVHEVCLLLNVLILNKVLQLVDRRRA